MELAADLHTHTTYSDGRGTPRENVLAALERGLRAVALTDHGPASLGTGVRGAGSFLAQKKEVAGFAADYPGIKVLVGAEAAVTGPDGQLDVPRRLAGELDILLAGLHPFCLPADFRALKRFTLPNLAARWKLYPRAKLANTNTKALVEAAHRHRVDVITHPGLLMPVDLDELARSCARCGCALEVNTGHHYNKEEVVRAALKWGAALAVNSDAHFPRSVGDLSLGAALLDKLGFPPEKVINSAQSGFFKF